VDGLARRHPFWFSVSMTTRDARPGEREGIDYRFVSEAEFRTAIDDGLLIEWAEYGGHLYGTPADGLERARADGRDVLLDIEIMGSRLIKERFPDAMMIFIAPPDLEELERRLRSRGDTSDEDMARRLSVAADQMAAAQELFDHFVVNDDLEVAIAQVSDILAQSPTR
jgi:guanylate kinase